MSLHQFHQSQKPKDYKVYTYTCNLQFAIQVHVAQKLEFLNSDQKVRLFQNYSSKFKSQAE